MNGKKKKRRIYPMITPPVAVPGVEIALSRHLWKRAVRETQALEMANAEERIMELAIAVEDDLYSRYVFTTRARNN